MNVRDMGFFDPLRRNEVSIPFGRVRRQDITLTLRDIQQYPDRHFHHGNLSETLACSTLPNGAQSKALFLAHHRYAPLVFCIHCEHGVPQSTREQHYENCRQRHTDRPIRVYIERDTFPGGRVDSNRRRH